MAREKNAAVIEAEQALPAAIIEEKDSCIIIYPLRSYLDGKEVKRAGGEGYKSPKHDANLLIAKGLATDTNPKA